MQHPEIETLCLAAANDQPVAPECIWIAASAPEFAPVSRQRETPLLKRLGDAAAWIRVTAHAQAVPAIASFLMQPLVI